MAFATRHRNDPMPELSALHGLEVRRAEDAGLMAQLQGRTELEIQARFDDGHRAYVAWLNEEPAAFGWVATRSASIGEMGTTLRLRDDEQYLWNFVTLPSHRGLGIYPRLLQEIIRIESRTAERFWIAYAPENRASGSGISKAGFIAQAEMSFDSTGRPALRDFVAGGAESVSRITGLVSTTEPLTPCWRCVRAGRGAMSCAEGACKCDYQKPISGCDTVEAVRQR